MDDFSTTHHVPGAFPETRVALPQKRERTTALPQIFVTPSSPSRPLNAPARSYVQDPALKAAFECTSAKSLEEALSYLDTSAKLLRQWSDQLGRLQGDLRQTAHKRDRLVISDGLVSLHWKLLDQSDRLRQAWILFTTTKVQSTRGPELDTGKPISEYAVIAEHSHEYQTTVTVEESEDDQMGLLTAFSDTVSDGPDELVTYYTPQHFHDYRTAVAVGKPEGSQMGLSTAFSDTSSDDFDELVTYYTPQASDYEGD